MSARRRFLLNWRVRAIVALTAVAVAIAARWMVHHAPARAVSSSAAADHEVRREPKSSLSDEMRTRAREGNEAAIEYLITIYASSSSDAQREDALDTLFSIRSLPRRLRAVLDAIDKDKTAPQHDPLWNSAVDSMAKTWIEERHRLNLGRELMLVESRPRPRLLMITALARAAQTGLAKDLAESERHAFAADLIDVYFEAASALAHNELETAVRELSGDDVGLVLAHGNNVDPTQLGVVSEQRHSVKNALQDLAAGRDIRLESDDTAPGPPP